MQKNRVTKLFFRVKHVVVVLFLTMKNVFEADNLSAGVKLVSSTWWLVFLDSPSQQLPFGNLIGRGPYIESLPVW